MGDRARRLGVCAASTLAMFLGSGVLASARTGVQLDDATKSKRVAPTADSEERGLAKVDRTGIDLDCQSLPPTNGPVPPAVLERCGKRGRTVDIPTSLVPQVQRGPIILEDATSATVNTSTIAGISTLTSFAVLTPSPGTDFPADVERTDNQHIYQITSSGAVSRYDSGGVQSAVSTIAPPAGQTWSELATDPTTGIVYGASVTCGTTSTLHTMNLQAGTRVQLGTITNATCLIGMAFTNGGQLFGYDIVNDSLLSIDKVTGAATIVGPIGFNANFGQGMDCDPASATCYLFAFNATSFAAELRSVNLGTGATTLIGTIGNLSPGGTVQVPGAVFATIGACTVDADCSDGNACNGFETCIDSVCQPGFPINCSDNLFCTIEICDPPTGVCNHPPNPCTDPDPCTLDSCNEANDTCIHTPLVPVRFCSQGATTIPASGQATPYPATVSVTGLSTAGALCSVEINGYSHTFPDDVDVLLSGPTGGTPNAIVMSDVGGGTDVANINLVLTDTAASNMSDAGPLASGTFKPTNIGTGDVFPAPAPVASGNTALNAFTGLNPNGAWSFWINDQFTPDGGTINQLCLNIASLACTSSADCNDGNLCNGAETCVNNVCQPGTPIVCIDGQFCTIDSCDPQTGMCIFTPNPCSDVEPCTIDSCDEQLNSCRHVYACIEFCNQVPTVLNDGPNGSAAPYPTTIAVSGFGAEAVLANVKLNGLAHTFPDDLDMLLVGPGGQQATILSDAGGSADVTGINLQLQDLAASQVADAGPLASGTFRPSNFDTVNDAYNAPAPPSTGTTSLSVFDNMIPDGTWSLYIIDDAGADTGTLDSWCLDIRISGCTQDSECNDGNYCNGVERCVKGQCQGGMPSCYDDGLFCTIDSCDPATGACHHDPGLCNDNDGCTVDSCDEEANACHNVNVCAEFCSQASVALNDGSAPTPASPYPTTITVAGMQNTAKLEAVRLNGVSHTFPDDIDMLLAGPAGQNAIIMSDVGGGTAAAGVNLILSDSAGASLPDAGPLVSGNFKPTNVVPGSGTETWPAPAPAPLGGSPLSVFDGPDPNGSWNLFIVDDENVDSGSMSAGWCIRLSPCVVPPEVHDSLRVLKPSPAMAEIVWDEDASASYSVYRGARDSLATWTYNQVCFDNDPHGQTALDPDLAFPGIALYYLVTRKNECGGESIPGRDSTGTPEPALDSCPLPGSDIEYRDEMDGGDDALHAGCHYRYNNATCTGSGTFIRGDTCVSDFLLKEWTDATCHHTNDRVERDCDAICVGMGRFGGLCVDKPNFCGANNDSAECQCFDALGKNDASQLIRVR